MLTNFKNKFLKIDKEEVIADARENDMDIADISDFRKLKTNYKSIETMMRQYANSFAHSSAIGGVTTGISGAFSSLTYAGIDTALLSLQLYRLAQRYAILNGFDPADSLHKNKIMRIYFEALGVNAAAQATLKQIFSSVNAKNEEDESDDHFAGKTTSKLANLFGKRISWGKSLFMPVVGGVVGVTASYFIAKKTTKMMQKSYKQAYFENWQ